MTLGTILTEYAGSRQSYMPWRMLQSNPWHPCQREAKRKPNPQHHSVRHHLISTGARSEDSGSSQRPMRRCMLQSNPCQHYQCQQHQRQHQCQQQQRGMLQSNPQASLSDSKTYQLVLDKVSSAKVTSSKHRKLCMWSRVPLPTSSSTR